MNFRYWVVFLDLQLTRLQLRSLCISCSSKTGTDGEIPGPGSRATTPKKKNLNSVPNRQQLHFLVLQLISASTPTFFGAQAQSWFQNPKFVSSTALQPCVRIAYNIKGKGLMLTFVTAGVYRVVFCCVQGSPSSLRPPGLPTFDSAGCSLMSLGVFRNRFITD